MRSVILVLTLAAVLSGCASKHYQVCVASARGEGCTHKLFTKKDAFSIRDILGEAPIPAQYETWVQDKRSKNPVPLPGPNDRPEVVPQSAPAPAHEEPLNKL
jgi:hypothetical protein